MQNTIKGLSISLHVTLIWLAFTYYDLYRNFSLLHITPQPHRILQPWSYPRRISIPQQQVLIQFFTKELMNLDINHIDVNLAVSLVFQGTAVVVLIFDLYWQGLSHACL